MRFSENPDNVNIHLYAGWLSNLQNFMSLPSVTLFTEGSGSTSQTI